MEPVAAAVEHALGVVDLAVAQQVTVVWLTHESSLLPWRPRRAAAGSASMMVETARSSWAADTNHASYADGGR